MILAKYKYGPGDGETRALDYEEAPAVHKVYMVDLYKGTKTEYNYLYSHTEFGPCGAFYHVYVFIDLATKTRKLFDNDAEEI